MKRIYTMLAAGAMLAATALWSGCSNNEVMENTTVETGTQKQAGSFSFNLKGTGAKTRATQTAAADESKVNAMYVALFINNEGEEDAASKLHRIFFYDTKNVNSEWKADWTMTYDNTDGEKFTITKDNMEKTSTYTGTYLAYFIANPEDAIEAELLGYLKTEGNSRTTLGDFEANLMAKEAVEGGTGDDSRGFTMLSNKEKIEIAESPRNKEIVLTRLAARFDFINSSPDNVTITNIKFNNLAKQSYLVPQSENTPEANLYKSGDAAVTKSWPANEGSGVPASMTVYAYENLNTKTQTQAGGNSLIYTSITVTYTLDADGAGNGSSPVAKELRIDLKEGDTELAVMRNHLYKINMNCVAGTYDLAVQEWQGGETVTVPNKDLAITYTANELGKIGDYVYVKDGKLAFFDGGLRKMYLDGSLEWAKDFNPNLTQEQKDACFGIVFSNQTSAIDQKDNYTRGYIVCKYVPVGTNNKNWKNTNTDSGFPKITTPALGYVDLDGRTYTKTILENYLSDYPYFQAFKECYNELPKLPEGLISEWFIPSCGQMMAILRHLGKLDFGPNQWSFSGRGQELSNNLKSVFYAVATEGIGIPLGTTINYHINSEYSNTQRLRLSITDASIHAYNYAAYASAAMLVAAF